jgi:hypothetical protein
VRAGGWERHDRHARNRCPTGAIIGNGVAAATCDNCKHTANVDNTPGPFSRGTANAVAEVINADSTSFAFTSRGVMVN